MRLILDTNRYSDLVRGVPEVAQVIADAAEVFVPFVVLAELHAGFRNGTRRKSNEAVLGRFLSRPGVRSLFPDIATVHIWSDLSVQLRRGGKPIPDHDLWIAALALQNALTLFARDAHFDHLPQLARI